MVDCLVFCDLTLLLLTSPCSSHLAADADPWYYHTGNVQGHTMRSIMPGLKLICTGWLESQGYWDRLIMLVSLMYGHNVILITGGW